MKTFSAIYKLTLFTLIAIALYIEIFAESGFRPAAFAYFTIQSNLLAAVFLALSLLRLEQSRLQKLRGIALFAIIITGSIYNFILYKIHLDWNTVAYGFSRTVTHVIAPLGFILDWLLFDRHGRMKLGDIFWWVAYPLLYAVASLFICSVTGIAIYPFFDIHTGGLALLAVPGVMLCILTAIAFAIVGIDKLIEPKGKKI